MAVVTGMLGSAVKIICGETASRDTVCGAGAAGTDPGDEDGTTGAWAAFWDKRAPIERPPFGAETGGLAAERPATGKSAAGSSENSWLTGGLTGEMIGKPSGWSEAGVTGEEITDAVGAVLKADRGAGGEMS